MWITSARNKLDELPSLHIKILSDTLRLTFWGSLLNFKNPLFSAIANNLLSPFGSGKMLPQKILNSFEIQGKENIFKFGQLILYRSEVRLLFILLYKKKKNRQVPTTIFFFYIFYYFFNSRHLGNISFLPLWPRINQ